MVCPVKSGLRAEGQPLGQEAPPHGQGGSARRPGAPSRRKPQCPGTASLDPTQPAGTQFSGGSWTPRSAPWARHEAGPGGAILVLVEFFGNQNTPLKKRSHTTGFRALAGPEMSGEAPIRTGLRGRIWTTVLVPGAGRRYLRVPRERPLAPPCPYFACPGRCFAPARDPGPSGGPVARPKAVKASGALPPCVAQHTRRHRNCLSARRNVRRGAYTNRATRPGYALAGTPDGPMSCSSNILQDFGL